MSQRTPVTIRLVAVLAGGAVLPIACSSLDKPREPPGGAPVTSQAAPAPPAARDDRPTAELQRRTSDLELRLLEKGAQVEMLQARLDDARREVVRAMAKLQSQATRAEAASAIAEAELALQSLPPTAAAEAVADARGLMAQSSTEFNKENYGGALYLANQAKSAVTTVDGQLATADQGSRVPGERALALPLHLETATGTNVREGPGTGFAVLFTLPARTPIVAYSSTEQWLRIADSSGRRGWVNQALIIRGQP